MNINEQLLDDYVLACQDVDDYAVNSERRRQSRGEIKELKTKILNLMNERTPPNTDGRTSENIMLNCGPFHPPTTADGLYIDGYSFAVDLFIYARWIEGYSQRLKEEIMRDAHVISRRIEEARKEIENGARTRMERFKL